jgi:enamine deaminase RidA (YjgF/YER057c/UK114 family)
VAPSAAELSPSCVCSQLQKLMTLERINPEDLPTPQTFTHVVVATGGRLVFIAGQRPEDEHGSLVGRDDLEIQARQVFANVGRALAAAGAGPEHVTKITISSSSTGVSTCQRSKGPGRRYSATTRLPTHRWEWRRCPHPTTRSKLRRSRLSTADGRRTLPARSTAMSITSARQTRPPVGTADATDAMTRS